MKKKRQGSARLPKRTRSPGRTSDTPHTIGVSIAAPAVFTYLDTDTVAPVAPQGALQRREQEPAPALFVYAEPERAALPFAAWPEDRLAKWYVDQPFEWQDKIAGIVGAGDPYLSLDACRAVLAHLRKLGSAPCRCGWDGAPTPGHVHVTTPFCAPVGPSDNDDDLPF